MDQLFFTGPIAIALLAIAALLLIGALFLPLFVWSIHRRTSHISRQLDRILETLQRQPPAGSGSAAPRLPVQLPRR